MNRKQLIYIGLILIVTVIVSASYFSYAFFTHRDEQHGKLNIVAGKLNYKIDSELIDDNNTVTVPGNSIVSVNIKITSLNDFDTKYILTYDTDSQDVIVYFDYDRLGTQGTIRANNSIDVGVIIENTGSSSENVTFMVDGGFLNQDIDTISTTGYEIDEGWETSTLRELAFDDNDTYLDENSNVVHETTEDGDTDGIYISTATDSGDPTYYFRGATYIANSVWFANKLWKIVRFNEDGSVRLILDSAIDNNDYQFATSASVPQFYDNNSNSNAYNVLKTWYNNNIGNNAIYDTLVVDGDFCQRSLITDPYNFDVSRGPTNMINRYPNFQCLSSENFPNNARIKIGMITYDELIFSGYPTGDDAFYEPSIADTFVSYLMAGYKYWTMSFAGFDSNLSTANAYIWTTSSGYLSGQTPTSTAKLRPVINLKAGVFATRNDQGYYVVY